MSLITGIQQVGIGVTNADEAKLLYKSLFGMDVVIFEDEAEASLMTQYTGKELHTRKAILSLNMSGGGGFEIWQYTSRAPKHSAELASLGDTGIFAVKIKTEDVASAYSHFTAQNTITLSPLFTGPDSRKHFWLRDSNQNLFNITEGDDWFTSAGHCGGVNGAVIGVTDMERSLLFYKEVLGINEQVYDITSSITDSPDEQSKDVLFRRVLLKKTVNSQGAFSRLLGGIEIELIEAKNKKVKKTYANRYWGDCGFIHLCFDVLDMDLLKTQSEQKGYPFTVDSDGSFSMGESAGRFCYVEDPDGTLIELVETHKVPILKKFGWYLNLKKRKHNRPLPNWMIGMLALNKIKS